MNELTLNFFKSIEDNSEEGFSKTKTMWEMSSLAAKNDLKGLSIQLDAVLEKNNNKFSLLNYVVECKNARVLSLLINNGADIKSEVHTLLCKAIKNNDIKDEKIALLLIQSCPEINRGKGVYLWYAVQCSNLKMAQLLIDNGAEVNRHIKKKLEITISVLVSHAWKSNKHRYPEVRKDEPRTITQSVTPIFQAAEQENVEMIRLLLLNDADISIKTINEKHDFTLPEKYESKSAEQILRIEGGGKTVVSENKQEPSLEEKCNEYKPGGKLAFCLEKIKLAKIAFGEGKASQTMRYLCDAYDIDAKFFTDYLSNKIRSINLGIYKDNLDPAYLLKFISAFCTIARDLYNTENLEAYKYFQESLLAELNGYDPENKNQPIKLFKTRHEKIEFVRQFSQGASWENSFAIMKSEIKSNTTPTPYSQSKLVEGFGLNGKENTRTSDSLNKQNLSGTSANMSTISGLN